MLLPAAHGFAADPATFRGDPAHSGIYASAEAPTLASMRWKFKTGGKVLSSPASSTSAARTAFSMRSTDRDGGR
jgi:hypothetical protein